LKLIIFEFNKNLKYILIKSNVILITFNIIYNSIQQYLISFKIIILNIKNKKFDIEVIKCYHSVPCVGYGFIEKRMKLKNEYKNLTRQEIAKLKRDNVTINFEEQYPIFCFLGDTSRKILDESSIHIQKYQTIMIECTFIMDSELEQADKTQHMHWKYLEKFVQNNQHINFVLYHFSQRYKRDQIKKFFDDLNLSNVVAWISN